VAVFAGVAISILTLARLFDFLFKSYPHYIWSFFFGLILASVFFVGKTVEKWRLSVVISLVVGTAFAFSVSVLSPASENSSLLYLFICGIVAACSMILPGLSGSFVLILLGNYQLVMIDSINDLNLLVLLPVVLGAVIGLLAFSHVLSWVFKKFKDQTIALLTGFILGSMGILWPWKDTHYQVDKFGKYLVTKSGEKVVSGYDWHIPKTLSTEVVVAVLLMIAGIFTIYLLEKSAQTIEES
jgi:putative membrane protein